MTQKKLEILLDRMRWLYRDRSRSEYVRQVALTLDAIERGADVEELELPSRHSNGE